jgi:hypothetical protein
MAQTGQQVVEPPEHIQDKIKFLFNNLTLANADEKADELRALAGETGTYWTWLAHYIVVKRGSIEPNHHGLYLQFIDKLADTPLPGLVLRQTYANISVLLDSPKIATSSSERSLLKNIGSWLGLLTLARNKPILMRDLAVKQLIIDGYQKNRLIYIIPFVAKVLEAVATSRVFRPPNPWTMAILAVLKELHMMPDLKLNLKFEVEVLCKNISFEIDQIEPSDILRPIAVEKDEPGLAAPLSKQPSLLTPPNAGLGLGLGLDQATALSNMNLGGAFAMGTGIGIGALAGSLAGLSLAGDNMKVGGPLYNISGWGHSGKGDAVLQTGARGMLTGWRVANGWLGLACRTRCLLRQRRYRPRGSRPCSGSPSWRPGPSGPAPGPSRSTRSARCSSKCRRRPSGASRLQLSGRSRRWRRRLSGPSTTAARRRAS